MKNSQAGSPSLSEQLRSHTSQAHEDAENSAFIHDLLGGKLDKSAFIALQEQSWLFYSALEKDLDALNVNPDWRAQVVPTAATAEYVKRLDEIAAAADFPRLMAHHYVRYLGDLSGGQVIARLVNREYGIPDEALNFYNFEEIGKIKPYKDNYRAQLDALDLQEAERAAMADEAALAFKLNQQVFAALR
ncbi:biliverdin-producing heme oxygenase [Corynebacterium callunae]|nr:biliverdin-producing heme oxygenase [Corynebacterium callunae]MCK2199370.1 biliverdin-producing heme oxygenase [Corynebacterium callunae]